MSQRTKNIILGIVAAIVVVLLIGEVAATKPVETGNNPVTICHRTNSATNPYNQNQVDADSADGDTDNDKGKKDHSEHTGPVVSSEAEAQELKDDKQKWGDIIPAHDNYAGLNWDTEGQAVYANDCEYTSDEKPPVDEPEEPSNPEPTPAVQTESTNLK